MKILPEGIPYPHKLIPTAPVKPVDDIIDIAQKASSDARATVKNIIDGGIGIGKNVIDGAMNIVDGVVDGAQKATSEGWDASKKFLDKIKPMEL